ncbi:T-complex protein 11-domain-containing protein [Tribonema minus]|uniref:T-complex protein 11-domain-containing protein n=1 Tax=Tribonema minus TaxID=303371 RepID=A0A835Z8D6_9STRA|nr:T-complex protein 11-domain-containing protein [Tribonema minus]
MGRKDLNISVQEPSSASGALAELETFAAAELERRRSTSVYDPTPEEEAFDKNYQAAERLHLWWRRMLQLRRTAGLAKKASKAFAVLATVALLGRIRSGALFAVIAALGAQLAAFAAEARPPFAAARAALRGRELQGATAAVLSCLPRDEALAAQPHSARGPRSLLSATIIAAYPQEVLVDEPESPSSAVAAAALEGFEARLLRCAAGLLVASLRALCAAVPALEEGEAPGSMGRFRGALGGVRFSRRLFAHAFLKWKYADAERLAAALDADAERLAAALVQPYAGAYAAGAAAGTAGDLRLQAMVEAQLEQYRTAMKTLIGAERALQTLQEVEVAVEADLAAAAAAQSASAEAEAQQRGSSSSARPGAAAAASPRASDGGGGGAAAAPNGGGSGGATARRMLGANERLAHELMLDPNLRLGTTSDAVDASGIRLTVASAAAAAAAAGGGSGGGGGGADEPLEQRIAHTMHRLFWESVAAKQKAGAQSAESEGRLVDSLSPAVMEAEAPADVRVGARVQARVGSAYYKAAVQRVTWLDDDGDAAAAGDADAQPYFDLLYEDGHAEARVPFVRLRRRGDALHVEPLQALLEEPSREEVSAKLCALTPSRADLNAETRAALDASLLGQMAAQGALDSTTMANLIRFIGQRIMALQAPARVPATQAWLQRFNDDMAAAASSGDPGAPVRLLPRIFEFVFARIDEVRQDAANAHVAVLVPYLQQHGVEYERDKFNERLSAGEVTLERTKAWLSSTVRALPQGAIAQLLRGDRAPLHDLVHRGLVALAQDRALSPNTLPETLSMDAQRIQAVGAEADCIAIAAAMLVLMRQVLSRQQVTCSGSSLARLQSRLSALMRGGGTPLQQLEEEVVAAAKEACAAADAALSSQEEAGLRGLLQQCSAPSNAVVDVFKGRVGHALVGYLGGGGMKDIADRQGMGAFAEDLGSVAARLKSLAVHNLKVHEARYSTLVLEAAAQQQPRS